LSSLVFWQAFANPPQSWHGTGNPDVHSPELVPTIEHRSNNFRSASSTFGGVVKTGRWGIPFLVELSEACRDTRAVFESQKFALQI
jgi:hypothetical protein